MGCFLEERNFQLLAPNILLLVVLKTVPRVFVLGWSRLVVVLQEYLKVCGAVSVPKGCCGAAPVPEHESNLDWLRCWKSTISVLHIWMGWIVILTTQTFGLFLGPLWEAAIWIPTNGLLCPEPKKEQECCFSLAFGVFETLLMTCLGWQFKAQIFDANVIVETQD